MIEIDDGESTAEEAHTAAGPKIGILLLSV